MSWYQCTFLCLFSYIGSLHFQWAIDWSNLNQSVVDSSKIQGYQEQSIVVYLGLLIEALCSKRLTTVMIYRFGDWDGLTCFEFQWWSGLRNMHFEFHLNQLLLFLYCNCYCCGVSKVSKEQHNIQHLRASHETQWKIIIDLSITNVLKFYLYLCFQYVHVYIPVQLNLSRQVWWSHLTYLYQN